MGVETVLLASAVIGAGGGGLFSAVESNKAARKQAGIYREQADAAEEAGRFQEAQAIRDFDTLLGEQKLSFAASGRSLEGSPLLILDQTIKDKETEVNNIRQNTAREASQLRSAARESKRAGRNALYAGIIGAASSGAKSYASYKGSGNPQSKELLGSGSGSATSSTGGKS